MVGTYRASKTGMSVETLIKKIEAEIKNAEKETQNLEGLQRLQEVMELYEGEHKLIWSHELQQDMDANPKSEPHKTGLVLLDALSDGIREQQLITISAHSKHGKTAFGLFLMEVLEQLHPVFIPLEQSAEELITQRVRNGYAIPRFLTPKRIAARVTVDWLEERMVEGIAKYNSRMIVIDHLGYIDDFGEDNRYGRENLAYRLQKVMQSLRQMAIRWNVVVVLLCHIQQQDEGKPPTLSDLKGSSGILQESDKVWLLWIKNEIKKKVRIYTTKVLLNVAANRQTGGKGNIGLYFDIKTGRYVEDNAWVESLERQAEASVEADEIFEDF